MTDVVSVLWAIVIVMCPGPGNDCPKSERVETRVEVMRADGCALADKECQPTDLMRVTRGGKTVAVIAADVLTPEERKQMADLLRGLDFSAKPRERDLQLTPVPMPQLTPTPGGWTRPKGDLVAPSGRASNSHDTGEQRPNP